MKKYSFSINTSKSIPALTPGLSYKELLHEELIVSLYTTPFLEYTLFQKLLLKNSKPNFETPTNLTGTFLNEKKYSWDFLLCCLVFLNKQTKSPRCLS